MADKSRIGKLAPKKTHWISTFSLLEYFKKSILYYLTGNELSYIKSETNKIKDFVNFNETKNKVKDQMKDAFHVQIDNPRGRRRSLWVV